MTSTKGALLKLKKSKDEKEEELKKEKDEEIIPAQEALLQTKSEQ